MTTDPQNDTIQSTYQGEVQLSAWGENRDEMWVRFKLNDGPDGVKQNPFKPYGKERKRFMLVAVPIADDETPERPKKNPEEKTEGERAVQRAGILCGEEKFRAWLKGFVGSDAKDITQEWAAEITRRYCGVDSRSELADNPQALKYFRVLDAEYRRATGQQAEVRG